MSRSALQRFSDLIRVDIVYEDADDRPKAYFDSVEDSPLMKDGQLRALLRENAVKHSSPFLYRDSFGVWFAAFAHGEEHLYLGPMCSSRLDPKERRAFFLFYQIQPEDAIRMSEQMDAGTGRLAGSDLIHWQTLAIIGITIVARAAISVGVSPAKAYHVGGYYITKINTAVNPEAALYYRNCGIEDFCARVREAKSVPESSEYTKRSKDYIQKHFREKIYIEDIAAPLGISAGYLSRLFKKETGMLIQDYINLERVERAANLLTYSDYSLSAIANYVHFPTQSYFGKIFKQIKGVTPNAYRKQHRISEFWQH